MSLNPMSEFKEAYTKVYDIQGKKMVFRTLSSKEQEAAEKSVFAKSIGINDDSQYNTRKIEVLSRALVSVDSVMLKNFPEVQAKVSKGEDLLEAIKSEISEWDDTLTTLLYSYYLKMRDEKDQKYKKELDFLSSQNTNDKK